MCAFLEILSCVLLSFFLTAWSVIIVSVNELKSVNIKFFFDKLICYTLALLTPTLKDTQTPVGFLSEIVGIGNYSDLKFCFWLLFKFLKLKVA